MTVCRLLGQLSRAVELLGRLLSTLAGLLHLRLIELLCGHRTAHGCFLCGVRCIPGRLSQMLHPQRGQVHTFGQFVQRLGNFRSGFRNVALRILLSRHLRGAVLL